MKTVPDLADAWPFMTHRELVAQIVSLKDRGEIDGYSIHKHPVVGYAAGVRVNDQWSYLGVG